MVFVSKVCGKLAPVNAFGLRAGALRITAHPQQDQNWQPFVRVSVESNNNSGHGSMARFLAWTIVVVWPGTEMPAHAGIFYVLFKQLLASLAR